MDSDSSESAIQIPKWKLILTLKEVLQVNETDRSSNPSKSNRPRDATDTFQKQHSEGWSTDSFHLMSYMSRVCELGKQLSTTHRWTESAKIFSAIARQICQCPIVVWKIGAQCLANHQDTSNDILHSFANTMIQVGRYARPTILFDHLTHLLSTGEYQEARQFMEAHKKKIGKDPPPKERAILNGYRGILEYVNWTEKKNLNARDEIPGNQLYAITSEAEVVLIAERAIEFLKESFCCSGNFDVFVAKLVDLLEYYERTDELREVLGNYLEMNKYHPTPYVFLYDYLVKYCPADIEQQIYTLKELADVCPSHHLLLTLCNLLPDEEFLLKVECLVNLVDYEEWRNNISVWKALVQAVTSDALRFRWKLNSTAYKELWDDRSLWWPAYHFKIQEINLTDEIAAELVVCKAIMIAVIYSSDHQYIQVVKSKLAVGEWTSEMDYLDKTLAVTHLLNFNWKVHMKASCSMSMRSNAKERNFAADEDVRPSVMASRKRKVKVGKKGTKTSVKSSTFVTKTKRGRPNHRDVIKVCNTFNFGHRTETTSSSESEDLPISRPCIKKVGRPKNNEVIKIDQSTASSGSESAPIAKSKETIRSTHKSNRARSRKGNGTKKPKNPSDRIPLIALSSSRDSSTCSDKSYRPAPLKVYSSSSRFAKPERSGRLRKKTKKMPLSKPFITDSDSSTNCEVEKESTICKKSNTTTKYTHVRKKKAHRGRPKKRGNVHKQERESRSLTVSRQRSIENARVAADIESSPSTSSSEENSRNATDPLTFKKVSVVLNRINIDSGVL